jgi:hypothetical protein
MNADAMTKRPNEMILAENTAREVPETFHFMELDQYQDLPYLEDHKAVTGEIELEAKITRKKEISTKQEIPDYDTMKEGEKAYKFSSMFSEEPIDIYDLPPQQIEVITPDTIFTNSTLKDEIGPDVDVLTISPGEPQVDAEPQVENFQKMCDDMVLIVDDSQRRHPPREISSKPRRTPNTNRPQFTLKARPPTIPRKKRKEIEKAKREGTYVPEPEEPKPEEDTDDDTLYELGNWGCDHPLWHLRNGEQGESDTDDDTPMIEIIPEVPYQIAIMKLLQSMKFPEPDTTRTKGAEVIDVINNSTEVMEKRPVPRPQRPPRRYPNVMPKSELTDPKDESQDVTCRVITVPTPEGVPKEAEVKMQFPPATPRTETTSESIKQTEESSEQLLPTDAQYQDNESMHAQTCMDNQDDLQDVEMESVAHSNCADLHEIEAEIEEVEQGVQWLEARNHNWNGSLTFLDLPLFHTAPNPFVIDVAADMKWNYHPILKVLRKDYPANFEESLMSHRKPPGTILETTTIEGQLIIFLITKATSLQPSTLHYLQKALTQLKTYLNDRPEIHTLNLPRLAFNIPWADVRPLLHQLIQDVNRPLQLTICWPREPQKPFMLHQSTFPRKK